MEIKLRDVNKKDWDYILELRNKFFEDDFLKQKNCITKIEHYNYMKKQESNTNFHQWISTDGREDIGYIRLLKDDVSIMVDQKFHSRFLAKKRICTTISTSLFKGLNPLYPYGPLDLFRSYT